MKRKLYILVLSAILVGVISATTAAQSDKRPAEKKKVQVVLVDKKERNKDKGETGEKSHHEKARKSGIL